MGHKMDIENRLIDIEMAIANLQRVVDDLNDVVIKQGKAIDLLQKENKVLASMVNSDNVKPLSEETPPPHY